MWASDFPHSDSTWPNSLEVIAHDFAGPALIAIRMAPRRQTRNNEDSG